MSDDKLFQEIPNYTVKRKRFQYIRVLASSHSDPAGWLRYHLPAADYTKHFSPKDIVGNEMLLQWAVGDT